MLRSLASLSFLSGTSVCARTLRFIASLLAATMVACQEAEEDEAERGRRERLLACAREGRGREEVTACMRLPSGPGARRVTAAS